MRGFKVEHDELEFVSRNPWTMEPEEREEEVAKHLPGQHDQRNHGRRGLGVTHGVRTLNPWQGEGKHDKQEVKWYLVNKTGGAPSLSLDEILSRSLTLSLEENGAETKRITENQMARYEKGLHRTSVWYGASPEVMEANMRTILASAFARYENDPSLRLDDMFYERWHKALFDKAQESQGVDFDDLIAAAAVISPGLDADQNLAMALELADIHDDPGKRQIPEAMVPEMIDYLSDAADLIRNPIYMEHHQAVIDGDAEVGDPRPPEDSEVRLAVAANIEADVELLRTLDAEGGDISTDWLSADGAIRTLHRMRKEATITDDKPEGAGFPTTKGYDNWANALRVLRGELAPDDILNGVKTRSFYNNILDPEDISGRDDVTVDFHTINFALMALGADGITHIQATPALGTVKLGLRPMVADAIRAIAADYDDLHGSRVQEILWAEWRRGQKGDTWVAFDGTVHELPEMKKPPKKWQPSA